MIHSTKAARFHYLDHARGFIILLVVMQHAINAYGQRFGHSSSFAPDVERSLYCDALYMLTDGFIMQALFFISGMFVLPSLQRRGWLSFSWGKTVRLIIPFFLGSLLIIPLHSFIKYSLASAEEVSYLDYWFNVYLFNFSYVEIDPGLTGFRYWLDYLFQGFAAGRRQSGGYWFIGVLTIFTFVAALVATLLPFVIRLLGDFVSWMVRRPILGYLSFAGITALLISISDIVWGTTNSVDLGTSLLWMRANMFMSFIFYFCLGLGVRASGILTQENMLEKMGAHWHRWVVLTVVLSVLYAGYIVLYMNDGAFSNKTVFNFNHKGVWNLEAWISGWPLLHDVVPGLLVRTMLHGFLCTAQTITVIVVLYRFTNNELPFWTSLATCSYGIYYFHELIVVWVQYIMHGSALHISFKVIISFTISLGLSWLITYKVLRRLPLTRRVF